MRTAAWEYLHRWGLKVRVELVRDAPEDVAVDLRAHHYPCLLTRRRHIACCEFRTGLESDMNLAASPRRQSERTAARIQEHDLPTALGEERRKLDIEFDADLFVIGIIGPEVTVHEGTQ